MAEHDGQERTERATPKRTREAREKGQLPRSRELNTTLLLLAASGGALLMGDRLVEGFVRLMRAGLSIERVRVFDEGAMTRSFAAAAFDALAILAPLLALLTVAALAAPLVLGGWSFSAKALGFKWERIDPIQGLGRIFAWRGLVELIKALVKFALVAAAAVALMWHFAPQLIGLDAEPIAQGLAHTMSLVAWAFLAFSAALIVVAAVDVPFQLWDHGRQLRMTRQEVRDEMKETEGKPEVKGRIRQLQQQWARRRMMAEVPKADVVVTNPTHYAVALRYDVAKMRAPTVVAKGADLVAAQIRGIAATHRVPQLSAAALARALYYSTELNREIPAGLYLAVAKVLAYVHQLRRGTDPAAPAPEELPIPAGLRRD